jgi:hypothetical protein
MIRTSAGRLLTIAVGILVATAASITTTTAAKADSSRSVCAGVSGCKMVVQRDVDGDGRRDQVGIVERHVQDSGSVTVRVRTAKGKHLQITNHDVIWFGKTWLGSAAIDGRRGAELVVGQAAGAHAMQFRVITSRRGKLVWLRAPKPFAGQATRIPRKNWLIDSSYSFNTGIYRSVSHGKVTLRVKSATRYRNDDRRHPHYHVTTSTYTWRSGHWDKQSLRKVSRSDKTAARIGGWHVEGLPRFPRL